MSDSRRAEPSAVRELLRSRLAPTQPDRRHPTPESTGGPPDLSAALADFVVGPISPELTALLAAPGAHAAVLIGLIEREQHLTVLLTERAAHLKAHAGQVAFPGGRIESDDPSPAAAALREAAEEVGLASEAVDLAGELPNHITGTGFVVTPVVGFVARDFVARPDPAEVADVFEVPLEFLLDTANVRERRLDRFGTQFRSYEFQYRGRRIWGATAAMLMTFRKLFKT